MDRAIFVENIKKYCAQRGVKPTVACRESGAGADLINQMERRGSIPSVERVQQLAAYLGVTTSELLGEVLPSDTASPAPDFLAKFRSLSPDDQDEVLAIIDLKHAKKKKGK